MPGAKPKSRSQTAKSLVARLKPRLRAAPAARLKLRRAEMSGWPEIAPLLKQAGVAEFLGSVAESSSFLNDLMADDPARLAKLLAADPEQRLKQILASTGSAWKGANEAELMAALRQGKQEVALLAGLADLGGVWTLSQVTGALSDFADAAIGAAVCFLLSGAVERGDLVAGDPSDPAAGSGWIVLGMGKLGAGELNYSSDIDLIVLYDTDIVKLAPEREPSIVFVRLTKRLVHILNERTVDGYVFRTDLRLRPDPGSTNIALSVDAALQYYESLGQNWERAALIKARPVAGDKDAGAAFLALLTPYIWRKYLDFAAIADIHSIKRQIHDHRGHEEIAVAGHNIKLGRGGIREIEFFVQTQQLVAGGRNPDLRGRGTLQVLAALAKGGWIDATTRDTLAAAYGQLRMVEHCLQMIADEQTHTLPEDDAGLAVVARMAGYRDVAELTTALLATLAAVRNCYQNLFETAPSLASDGGSLVFTGDSDDPDTLAALQRLGYRKPEDVVRAVRAWHFGRYPAMRSATARQRLTEFVPALIDALARSDNADTAFLAFDHLLSRLPSGVQLFSLLQSQPQLLDLLAMILSTAPRLAETIVQRAHVLDALIEPAFLGEVPQRAVLEAHLEAALKEARSFEDLLDRARIFGQEHMFLIGVRVLADTISARRAAQAYSDLADLLLVALLDAVVRQFEAVHGRMKGGKIALVALGRLGAREMTATSDLDLLLLYDFDEKVSASDGKRSLPGSQYYARLTQRIVAAISAPTGEGTLYPVDFRLRPSGNAGPLATSIGGFVAYQQNEAWTWEHMALTRARVVAGDKALAKRAETEIRKIIARPRASAKVVADVLEMRALIEEEKGGEGIWDLKQAPGGVVDIEFVAQALQLMHGAAHPEVITTDTEAALAAAAKVGLLPGKEADILLPAYRLYQSLFQVLRLCADGRFDPADAPRGLLTRLAAASELPDFPTLEAALGESERSVRGSFERIFGKRPPKKK